jgi:16S rRNA (guanine527-N7)-methyltransferase
VDAPLLEVLEESKRLGFLGPGPVQDHIDHAHGFLAAVAAAPGRFLDLGSGGGVPGLVLALAWTEAEGVLLDASSRRTAFLRRATIGLGIAGRVAVVTARAEEAAHDPALRATFDVVTARGFAPPSRTAEYGAAFLRTGGTLLVSEPPQDTERWETVDLGALGLELGNETGSIRSLVQRAAYPSERPRRR